MSRWSEPVAWIAALAALSLLVAAAGRERAALERRLPLEAKELYRTLARSRAALQIVDVRQDLAAGYGESHVPGAIPLPGCDLARAPAPARERIHRSAPTVLVGASGAPEETARCAGLFTSARTLAGGMESWTDAGLPEDSGDYAPPSSRAGGGCL